MRLKLKGQKGYLPRSAHERDLTHALVKAGAEYDRLQQRIKEGAIKRQNDPSVRNSVLTPAKKALKMEQSALREIFADAHARKRIKYLPTIKITRDVGDENRRPHFDRLMRRPYSGQVS